MRYFKTADNKILCTFLRPGSKLGETEVIHRCKNPFPEFPKYDPGVALYPSPEIPTGHGLLIEISEDEALEADPGLFEKGFQDYEEMKRLEPAQEVPVPATARRRKVVRELVQDTLF